MASGRSTDVTDTGYDAIFERELEDKYKCPVCLAALKDPVQTKCGHRFCRLCLRSSRGKSLNGKCPVDKTWYDPARHVFEDNATKREILSLGVKCDHQVAGCIWKGELRHREEHLKSCPEVEVSCDNDCGATCVRRSMSDHVTSCPRRIEPCQKCGLELVAAEIAKHQLLVCEKFPVTCSLCSETSILREDMARHVDPAAGECPLVTIQCQFASIGCYFQDKRQNLPSHYQSASNHHMQLVAQKVQHQQDQLVSQQRSLLELTEQCQQSRDQCDQLRTVTEQQQRMIQDQGNLIQLQAACILELEGHQTDAGRLLWRLRLHDNDHVTATSPAFSTHQGGYAVRLVLDPASHVTRDGEELASLYLKPEPEDKDTESEPFDGKCHVIIFDQSEQRDTFKKSFSFSLQSAPAVASPSSNVEKSGLIGFMSTNRLLSSVYNKDNNLLILVEIRRNNSSK